MISLTIGFSLRNTFIRDSIEKKQNTIKVYAFNFWQRIHNTWGTFRIKTLNPPFSIFQGTGKKKVWFKSCGTTYCGLTLLPHLGCSVPWMQRWAVHLILRNPENGTAYAIVCWHLFFKMLYEERCHKELSSTFTLNSQGCYLLSHSLDDLLTRIAVLSKIKENIHIFSSTCPSIMY